MNHEPSAPFASVTGLGRLLQYFPYNKTSIFGNACGLGIGTLILSGILLKELLRLSDSTVCFGSIALSAGAIFLITRHDRRNWPYGAALYEDGFANHGHTGLVRVRWDEIKTLEHWVGERELVKGLISWEDSISHRYIVRTQSNEETVLTDSLLGHDDLWAAIGMNAAAAVLDHYLAVIQSGQTIAFGPFSLDAHGLHYGPEKSDKSCPADTRGMGPVMLDARAVIHRLRKSQKARSIAWNEIGLVQLRPQRWQPNLNEIVVMERVPSAHPDHVWAHHIEHEIPNCHIFLALCKHLGARATPT